jgi:hypothetical protein
MTYFKKKKNFTSQKSHFPNFPTHEPKKDNNATELRKMPFIKQSYVFFANPKLHEG